MKVIERVNALGCKAAAAAAVKQAGSPAWQKRLQAVAPLLLVLAAVSVPELAHAQAQPWTATAEKVLDLLMDIARVVAIICVVACGFAAMMGKLSWEWCGKIVLGLVLIFAGASIVDYFSSAL